MRRAYSAFEQLVAPARPSATPLRLILGLVLCVMLVFTFVMLTSAVLNSAMSEDARAALDSSLDKASDPTGVLVNLFIFVFVLAALEIALRKVHGRSLGSVIGDWNTAKVQFKRTCGYLLGLYVVLMVFMPSDPDIAPQLNLEFGTWILYLPLALPALLIQVGAEEVLFRGYMQSQLAARYGRPLVWIVLPSVIFGLLHYDAELNGNNAWLVVLWATAFGVVAADLTARSGTLGPAVALHFFNNFYAIFVAAPSGYFDGMALYTYPFEISDDRAVWAWAPVDLMMLFVSWLTIRLALRR